MEKARRVTRSEGRVVVGVFGAERVRQAVLESIRPYRLPSGVYRLNNKFRYLIAQRRDSQL
jgi:hypothetical protein